MYTKILTSFHSIAWSTLYCMARRRSSCLHPTLHLLQLPPTRHRSSLTHLHNKRLDLLDNCHHNECQFWLLELLGNDVCTLKRGIETRSNSWHVCSSESYYRHLHWYLIFNGRSMAGG